MLPQASPSRQGAFARALARAHREGTEATYHLGQWYASSTSQRGQWHKVDPILALCECEASKKHLFCKHLAAVEETCQQPCRHCGRAGDSVRRWERVHSELSRAVVECRDRRACHQRQEEKPRGISALIRACVR